MLTREIVYSGAVMKKLRCGEVFKAANSFPLGELSTNKQVIEPKLIFPDFRTLSAARKVVHELHDRWVWCNVYPEHHYTIATKIQETMTTFSKITGFPRKTQRHTRK